MTSDKFNNMYKSLNTEQKKLYSSISWLRLFGDNGWKWVTNLENEMEGYLNYTITLLSENYDCEIIAFVSEYFEGIDQSGDIGISWLEVKYEYVREYYDPLDLQDMLIGIAKAEKNLVTLGIPFKADYKFHQKSEKENKALKKQNEKNRKKLKCDEVANLWNIAYENMKGNKNENESGMDTK